MFVSGSNFIREILKLGFFTWNTPENSYFSLKLELSVNEGLKTFWSIYNRFLVSLKTDMIEGKIETKGPLDIEALLWFWKNEGSVSVWRVYFLCLRLNEAWWSNFVYIWSAVLPKQNKTIQFFCRDCYFITWLVIHYFIIFVYIFYFMFQISLF